MEMAVPQKNGLRNGAPYLSRVAPSITLLILLAAGLLSAQVFDSLPRPTSAVATPDSSQASQVAPRGLNERLSEREGGKTSFITPATATPRVVTGQTDFMSRPITVSCASCHANFTP